MTPTGPAALRQPPFELAAATADEHTGIVVHLRMGDAGDLDLLVDRGLVVLGVRLETPDRQERTGR